MKKVLALGLLTITIVAACSSKKRIRPEPQDLDLAPQGKFKAYSEVQLKKAKLKPSDFESDAFDHRGKSIHPELKVEQSEKRQLEILQDERLITWLHTMAVKELGVDSVLMTSEGLVRAENKSEKVSFSIECLGEKTELSTGVVDAILKCAAIDYDQIFNSVDTEIENCSVKGFGPNPTQRELKYGSFRPKESKKSYKKSHMETITTQGDIYCDGTRGEMGREVIVSITTAEAPNVLNPAVGARKKLFESRLIVGSSGKVYLKLKDELLSF